MQNEVSTVKHWERNIYVNSARITIATLGENLVELFLYYCFQFWMNKIFENLIKQ